MVYLEIQVFENYQRMSRIYHTVANMGEKRMTFNVCQHLIHLYLLYRSTYFANNMDIGSSLTYLFISHRQVLALYAGKREQTSLPRLKPDLLQNEMIQCFYNVSYGQ